MLRTFNHRNLKVSAISKLKLRIYSPGITHIYVTHIMTWTWMRMKEYFPWFNDLFKLTYRLLFANKIE